ncbi:MAG TPA: hypothetical protein VGF38_17635 [Ktedonobacterales bacterium]
MRSHGKTWPTVICALLACIIVLFGCSLPGTTTSSSSTPGEGAGATATGGSSGPAGATATPTPPPHALAWFQSDSHHVGQIWASINGGAAHQVTHMPSSTADCPYNEFWSPPVFSPNLSKIAAAWGSSDCTDGAEHGPIYIINATTGAATKVASSDIRLSLRQTGWIDNSTIWWIDGRHVYRYTVGGATSTNLGALGGNFAEDAVLRSSTLYYTTHTGSGLPGDGFQLQRFDMTSHSVLAGSVNLGATNPCECSRNDAMSPGFDVSHDGSHIVYQKVSPVSGSGGDEEGVASSQFFYANADGSGASRIATVATAASMVKMQISPNGRLVAVARAEPAPSVFTASVTSAGLSGDPSLHFYTPDGRSYPVWKTDNATFWAGTKDLADIGFGPATNMEHFDLGVGAGSVGAAGGSNPWYTIGS